MNINFSSLIEDAAHITGSIWIGKTKCTSDENFIKINRITKIYDVTTEFQRSVDYLRNIVDTIENNIYNGSTLIVDDEGAQLTPTIMVAYMMIHKKLTLQQSIQHVKASFKHAFVPDIKTLDILTGLKNELNKNSPKSSINSIYSGELLTQ